MSKINVVKNLLLLFLLIIYITTLILIQNSNVLFADEWFHLDQVLRFVRGNYSPNPDLYMLPGYHLVISVVAKFLQTESYYILRTVSFLINVLIFFVFYRITRLTDPKNVFGKTSLLAFLPVLFPYLFLLYTDGFSLLVVLLTYYFILKKRYFFSGITGTYSLFVRQNNLLFILFFYFLLYIQNYGWKIDAEKLKNFLRKIWILIPGFIIFGVSFVLSERILGNTYTRSAVRFSASSFANIYFYLFVVLWLFLPLHLANLRKIMPLLRKRGVIFFILLALFLFLFSFIPDHPSNQEPWFLHNGIFQYFSADLPRKILFFITVIFAALSLGVTKMIKKEYYLLYPFTVLYLLPLKMVEIRYYIIPVTFFLLFMNKKRGPGIVATGVIFMSISLFFLWGMLTTNFFP